MSKKFHQIKVVQSDDIFLYLEVDGQLYRIRWTDCSLRLAEANQTERDHIDISPSGYGLHWPLVDEDLAVDPLLEQAELLSKDPAPTAKKA